MAESKPEEVRSGGVAPEAAVAKIVPEPAAKDEFTVFYAWQSDLRSQDNRSFIESALETSLKNIQCAGSIQQSPRLDKDTQGVSGIPDIASTILEKIRAADALVADVSFVAGASIREGSKGGGDRVPNPNVMIELGYALSELGWERIVLVLNTATGKPEELPFDLRNRRWPFLYELRPETDQSAKGEAKKALSRQLETGVRAIAGLPPRRKRVSMESRVDALETMVSALSGSVSHEASLASIIAEVRKSLGGNARAPEDPKAKCQASREDLIARVSGGTFYRVIFQQGMFVMVVCPTSAPSPLPLFESANEEMIKLGLQPLSGTSWDPRPYGDRFAAGTSSNGPADAATEITSSGVIAAAGHDVMAIKAEFFAFSGQKAPADIVPIPSAAFEKRVIEGVFGYLKLLKALGSRGPCYVGIGLINVKKSFLYTDPRFQFGGGAFEGDQILPDIVEVPSDVALDNPQGVARALRPAFDYVWREHRFPRSLNYVATGDWVGGR